MKRALLVALALLVGLSGALFGQSQLTLNSISPTQTSAGGPGFAMTLVFSNLPVGSVLREVLFNGTPVTPTFIPPSQITAQIPAGLILSSGTVNVVISIQFVSGAVAYSNALPFAINAAPVITTTTPLPSGLAGSSYFQVINATGGTPTLIWSVVSGAPPPGLTLSPGSGSLTGTPTTPGAYRFAARVTDALGFSATRTFDINIAQSGTTQGLDGQVGVAYTATLIALSGTTPWTWQIPSGLPPGLTLNSTTGQISGIPTTAGTFNFIATWTDSQGLVFPNTFAIRILAVPLTITTTSPLNTMTLGVLFSQTLAASGGTPPYLNWRIVAGLLPAGLTLDAASGVISGAPTAPGSGTAQVSVNDSAQAPASKAFSWTVNAAVVTITTNSALPNGTVGTSYAQPLQATGGISPYTWSLSAGALPPGLALSTAGALGGTPTQSGAFNFTVGVSDNSGGSTSKAFSITVNAPTLTITTASPLPNGTAPSAYSQTFAVAGGISPYTWSLASGTLPVGLTLSAAGVLSGAPTQSGTSNFTVGVADSSGGSTSKAFSLTVTVTAPATLSITGLTDTATPAQQPNFDVQIGAAYPLQITGTVTLTFTPNAVNAANDPAIQFSGGGRTLNFTIAAGQTRAFPTTLPSIQTGTVAGQIDLTLSFSAGGQNITPAPAPVRSVIVARTAPKINTVQVVKVTGGFNILVTGYSTPRQVTQAVFTFTPASGANLQTTQVTVPVDSTFTTWYTGTSSPQFGSSFLYTQPFTVQGSVGDIVSVSVTLSNATGSSAAVSGNF